MHLDIPLQKQVILLSVIGSKIADISFNRSENATICNIGDKIPSMSYLNNKNKLNRLTNIHK